MNVGDVKLFGAEQLAEVEVTAHGAGSGTEVRALQR